ncbi:Hypothetical protein, putative [Bodo saltans]|uniref:C3H1-type domain-containing protein n=1 Tax=Bodo saltans TaxID=75058 RepID=A0A0S4J8D0_BODSA|nr:Hypothetical protein, putative [Bodo saltans]|eukprot:CUG86185.1 Hypothetical protein, putative [Bodo saltans]
MTASSTTDSNRLVEELPVSYLCVGRKLQEKPYEAIHPLDLSQSLTQQMALRPPPFVAQDTLFQYYSILQGHCNIPVLQVQSIELFSSSSAPSSVPSAGCGVNAQPQQLPSAQQVVSSSSMGMGGGGGGVLGSAPSSNYGQVSSGGDGESYRLAQIRQNERHVNSKSARVCSYFNTREGCRRGPNCPFIHNAGIIL